MLSETAAILISPIAGVAMVGEDFWPVVAVEVVYNGILVAPAHSRGRSSGVAVACQREVNAVPQPPW